MKNALVYLVLGVAVALVALPARATVDVQITPSNGGTWSVTTVNGREQVVLTRFANVTGTVDFLVTGAISEVFDTITVETNNSAYLTTVTVQGPFTGTTGSVEAVRKTGTGAVRLDELRISGALGANLSSGPAIDVDSVVRLIVGGTVHASVLLVDSSFESPSAVGGDFLGNLVVSNGSILNLPVTGHFGDPNGSAVTLTVGGDVAMLSARSFNADITVGGSIDTLKATGTSDGNFKGSLTASAITDVTAGVGDGLSIAKALFGEIEIAEDVTLPVSIGVIDGAGGLKIDGDVDITAGSAAIEILLRCEGTVTILGELDALLFLATNAGDISVGSVASFGGIVMADTETYTDSQNIFVAGNCSGTIVIGTSGNPSADLRGTIEVAGSRPAARRSACGATCTARSRSAGRSVRPR